MKTHVRVQPRPASTRRPPAAQARRERRSARVQAPGPRPPTSWHDAAATDDLSEATAQPAAPAYSFANVSLLAPKTDSPLSPTSSAATPAALLDHAAAEPGTPLPQQEAVEARLGHSLDGAIVHSGPATREALDALGAEAATRGHDVFLAEPDPGLDVLTHEAVHTLQATAEQAAPDIGAGPGPSVVAEHAPAEQEADRLTQQVLYGETPATVEPAATVATGTVALLRPGAGAPPAPPPGSAGTPAEAFKAVTAPSTAPARPSTAPAPPSTAPSIAPASGSPTASAAPATTGDAGPATGDTAAATGLVPAAPVPPGLSPEEIAAEQQATAEATAALAAAEDVGGLVDAFAGAPPTVMAQHYDAIGADADRLAKSDEESYQQTLPEMHAQLSGEVAEAPPLDIASPATRDLTLEPTPPPPAPEPEVAPTVDPGPFIANERVADAVARLFGGQPDERAGEIGQALTDVKTTDPDIVTSPGAAPTVPLEGENDPERMARQQEQGATQARQVRDEAKQAVIDGPGPELVQPRVMDEVYPLADLAAPTIQPPGAVDGPAAYLAMGLPPDVQMAFDEDQQATMQASMEGPSTQVADATTERDTGRESEVNKAETELQKQTVAADAEQRSQVQDARDQIQDDRRSTLEAQTQAVTDAEASVETERKRQHGEVDTRVAADQKQIDDRYDKADRDAKAEVQKGETKAAEERAKAEREAENQSWWDRAVSFVKDAFNALTSLIGKVFDAVRSVVNGILDAVKKFATELIDAVAGFIKGVIAAFGEFLKLAIDGLIGQIFPDLAKKLKDGIDSAVTFAQKAVDTVADGLKKGINAIVGALQAGLNAVLNVFQAAITLGLGLLEAAVTGDWGALARKVLESVLRLAGISPDDFYAFVGRAEETFQIIVDDPGSFLGHAVDAVVGGFQKFSDNFLPHLEAGVIGWLTGALGGAGITLPEHFDLMGVLDLARQILGLTWDRLRKRAVDLIGEQNVERIELVASYLQTLITGGWAALLERISQGLNDLRDSVLGQIQSFLLEKVVTAAITRLVTLFNPVGAIVQLVMAAWSLYTFLRDQLTRIIEVLKAVVEMIGDIARGVIDPAATKVEAVLASLLPLALDLLARFLGLSGVGEKVREIVEAIRERVDAAVDRLINWVIGLFKGKGKDEAATAEEDGTAAEGVPKELVEPAVAHLGEISPALTEEIDAAASGTVIFQAGGSAAEVTTRLLHDHPEAHLDPKSGELTLPRPDVKPLAAAASLKELGTLLGGQLDVARLVLTKSEHGYQIDAEINPKAIVLTGTEVDERTRISVRGADNSLIDSASFSGTMEGTLRIVRGKQIGKQNVTLDHLRGNRNYALANIQVSGVSAGRNLVVFSRPVANASLLMVFSSGAGQPGAGEKVKLGIQEANASGDPVTIVRASPENLDVNLFVEPPKIIVAQVAEMRKFIDRLAPVLEVGRTFDFQAHRHSEQVVWQLIRLNQKEIAGWVDKLDVVEITQFVVNIHSEREMCRNCAAASNYMLANMKDELPEIWEALQRKRAATSLKPETLVTAHVEFPPRAPRLVGTEGAEPPRRGIPLTADVPLIGSKLSTTLPPEATQSLVQVTPPTPKPKTLPPGPTREAIQGLTGEREISLQQKAPPPPPVIVAQPREAFTGPKPTEQAVTPATVTQPPVTQPTIQAPVVTSTPVVQPQPPPPVIQQQPPPPIVQQPTPPVTRPTVQPQVVTPAPVIQTPVPQPVVTPAPAVQQQPPPPVVQQTPPVVQPRPTPVPQPPVADQGIQKKLPDEKQRTK